MVGHDESPGPGEGLNSSDNTKEGENMTDVRDASKLRKALSSWGVESSIIMK